MRDLLWGFGWVLGALIASVGMGFEAGSAAAERWRERLL